MTLITIHSRTSTPWLETVEDYLDASYRDALNEVGSWSLTVPNTPEYRALFAGDNLVAFRDFDRYAFWGVIEADNVIVSGDATTITATGRGLLSLFERGVLYPSRGLRRASSGDRFFGWGSADMFPSGFGAPFSPPQQAPIEGELGTIEDWPTDDPTAMWPVIGGPRPGGERAWFYRSYTTTAPQRFRMDAAGDNAITVWVDDRIVIDASVLASDPAGIMKTMTWRGVLPAGTHWFMIRGENIPADMSEESGIGVGPAWVAFRLASISADDEDIGTAVMTSAGPWVATLGEPGWPIGTAALLAISEAETRGVSFAPVVCYFASHIDSYGQDWAYNVNRSWQVGTDLLTFVQDLTESGADFWIDPQDRTLRAAPQRGADRSTDVILFPGKHLPDLTIARTRRIRNTAIVSTKIGYTEVVIGGSVSQFGRRETLINLGSEDSIVRATATANETLNPEAWPSRTTNGDKTRLQPTEPGEDGVGGTRPFVDFEVGDIIGFPGDDGQISTARVLGITRELSTEPKWFVEVDLAQAGARSVKPSAAQRTLRIAKSGGAASIGGIISSATK